MRQTYFDSSICSWGPSRGFLVAYGVVCCSQRGGIRCLSVVPGDSFVGLNCCATQRSSVSGLVTDYKVATFDQHDDATYERMILQYFNTLGSSLVDYPWRWCGKWILLHLALRVPPHPFSVYFVQHCWLTLSRAYLWIEVWRLAILFRFLQFWELLALLRNWYFIFFIIVTY